MSLLVDDCRTTVSKLHSRARAGADLSILGLLLFFDLLSILIDVIEAVCDISHKVNDEGSENLADSKFGH